jgi:hypothetical protein
MLILGVMAWFIRATQSGRRIGSRPDKQLAPKQRAWL